MSKDRKKLLHIHSSVYDKQPTPETLEVGELGVNNASGNTFISTKNSADEVVRFSEDNTIVNWMDEKEVFPYEAYVRGSDPSIKGVTVQDRAQNKSNIIIKLNQVAPIQEDTDYDLKVNGAKDIYGNLINPIGGDGYKDGAGIAIDMSNYAMIGANPSFSSITSTCEAKFYGTTEIKGTDGDCGSKLDVNVNEVCIEANDTLNIYGVNESNFGTSCDGNYVSTKTTLKGDDVLVDGNRVAIDACDNISAKTNNFTVEECANGGKVSIGTTSVGVSASTTDIKSCNKFEVKSNDIVFEQCDGASGKILLKACDEIRLNSRNIIFSDVDCQSGQTTMESSDLCLVGEEKVTLYGKTTNVGIDCDDDIVSLNTNIYGNTINENGDTISIVGGLVGVNATTTDLGLTAKQDIVESAEGDITINADGDVNVNGGTAVTVSSEDIYVAANDKLCESGNTAYFYGAAETHIGVGCDGNKSANIVYERISGTGACDIKATTIDGALDEVLDRDKIHISSSAGTNSVTYTVWQDSGVCENKLEFTINDTIITMSGEPSPASAETSKVYTLYQTTGAATREIGTIDIPKDHILKDVAIKHGHYDESTDTFIECVDYDPQSGCTYYIKMVWNVFESGHTDDRTVYLPADDFIQDIDEDNSYSGRGVHVDVWYDGSKNRVSADTELIFNTTNGDFSYEKKDGKHYENGTTLTFEEGSFTDGTYQPWVTSKTVKVPTCVNHLNRHTIKFQSGSTSSFNNQTYDPGKDCANSAETINIPTEVGHLNRGKFTVKHCNDEVIFDPSTDTSITMTHSALTYTHNGFSGTYDPCSGGTFDAPHSALTITYGNPCSSDRSGVTYNTSADTTIIVPQTIADVTNNVVSLGGTCAEPGCLEISTDICMGDNTIVANSFYSTSDERMKENIQSLLGMDARKSDLVEFKTFNFKNDETKSKTYGVIAQDVLAAGLNEIVHKDENDNLSVDYISFLILKIASLENKIGELSNEINELKKQNNN